MPKTLFTIDTLGDLDDGTTRLVVDQALADALADCDNRPNLDKPRRVVITVELLPVPHDVTAGMKGVGAEVAVKLSVPARKTRSEYLKTSVNAGNVEAWLPEERPQPLFPASEEKN